MKESLNPTPAERRNRRVMSLNDFTVEDIAAIEQATPPAEAMLFDGELE